MVEKFMVEKSGVGLGVEKSGVEMSFNQSVTFGYNLPRYYLNDPSCLESQTDNCLAF